MYEDREMIVVEKNQCSGCTRCMRVCPTEAIRIMDKKVHVKRDLCIQCGNCLLNCQNKAFQVKSDDFSLIKQHKVNVAILPLAMYGMISNKEEHQAFIQTILDLGFDEVFDLSVVTDLIAEKIDTMLKKDIHGPFIMTQCPTVIRLIQKKYPSLIHQLLPFDFPFEIGAKMAEEIISGAYKIKPEEIGISYISECLSNVYAIKQPLGKSQSRINHVFLLSDLLRPLMNHYQSQKKVGYEPKASKRGILFAKVGGINRTTEINEYISVDGINNVSDVLEKIYLNTIPSVKLIEAYACVGGCIGGVFTLENTFVSKWKINHYANLISELDSQNWVHSFRNTINYQEWYVKEPIMALDSQKLSDSLLGSIQKMNQINALLDRLPKMDCCACGSPTCRALASDIVNGEKTLADCVVLRNRGDEE
jgi:iron only hydrogenase large subunit-like protein